MCFFCQTKENEEMRLYMAELSSNNNNNNSSLSDSRRSGGRGDWHGDGRGDGDGDGGGGGGDGDVNDPDMERSGEAWCVQDGRVYDQGEDWEVDSCTSCTCQVSVE